MKREAKFYLGYALNWLQAPGTGFVKHGDMKSARETTILKGSATLSRAPKVHGEAAAAQLPVVSGALIFAPRILMVMVSTF